MSRFDAITKKYDLLLDELKERLLGNIDYHIGVLNILDFYNRFGIILHEPNITKTPAEDFKMWWATETMGPDGQIITHWR